MFNSRKGYQVELSTTSPNLSGIWINTIEDNNDRKAFVVYNSVEQKDVFRVYGNGIVYATEVNVRVMEEFPDYVFSEDYELMSIAQLREYISDNGKLPKLPTAEQVAETGIDLGEMNKLLVEKIEELTLYLLMLEEKIQQLENEE